MSQTGGFLMLKENGVTLSFYPKTKTLNVQRAKKEDQTDDEHVDDVPNDGDNEIIRQNHDEHVYNGEQAFHHCPGCKENADAINELKQEFVKLNEQLKKRDFTPSYDELFLRIKPLEEERDSLVKALRVLSGDVEEHARNTITVDLNEQQQASIMGNDAAKEEEKSCWAQSMASGNITTSQSKLDQNKPCHR